MLHPLKQLVQGDPEEILYQRTRIPVKVIYRNEGAAAQLNSFLLSLKGVRQAKTNPVTGRVLVIFDETEISQTAIEKEISKYTIKLNATRRENVITLEISGSQKETASTACESIPHEKIIPLSNRIPAYHALGPNQIEKMLKTSYVHGLPDASIQAQTKKYGFNVISEQKRKSLLSNILEGLNNLTVKVLLGAGAVSFVLGQVPEAIALGGIVLFQTVIGAIEQYRSENSLSALKNMLVQKSKVIRKGKIQEINAKYLVPGDVIICEAGDKIPADARILECEDLKTAEASLTGESTAVNKSSKICPKDTEPGSRHNILFMGTNILSGRCKAVVIATGKDTEIGKIASMLDTIQEDTAPLQNRTEAFINKMIRIYLRCFAVIGGIALLRGRGFAQVLMMGVTFFLGSIPEGLPVTVTTCMAMSVHRMAKKNAIVRKLTAVESLGSADVICCDKTGTLTMNEMTVRKIYADGYLYDVSGLGYSPNGKISLSQGDSAETAGLEILLRAGILCNTSSLIQNSGKWEVQGDPTEGALLTAAHKGQMTVDDLKKNHECIKAVPFDSHRRYMTSVVKNTGGEIYAYCKGALDTIMAKCNLVYSGGQEKPFTPEDREKVQSLCDEMAEKTLRVLAFAYKPMHQEDEDIEHDLVFLGVAAMEDPPREGVKKSIQKCLKAGIQVVMITGDHVKTASAIGRDLGLLTDGLAVCGSDVDHMTDRQLECITRRIQVFARTTPEQKYRIVKAFKRCGHVVAMTGDGVNDAPAIKEAHIGIAMGKNGSDVARDAACITLVDDNFSTIVAAIEEGRGVSKNIENTMKYLFAGAIGEMLSIFLSFAVGLPAPLLAIQMIWINLVSETLLGSTLAFEPPAEDVMQHPPVPKNAPLIHKKLRNRIVRRGIGIGFSTFAIFTGSMLLGANLQKARTLAFGNFICTQIANIYDSRSNRNDPPSKYMKMMTVSAAALLTAIIYLPFLNSLFGTVPLGPLSLGGLFVTTSFSRI